MESMPRPPSSWEGRGGERGGGREGGRGVRVVGSKTGMGGREGTQADAYTGGREGEREGGREGRTLGV